jgi:6-phosphofructokinase 1
MIVGTARYPAFREAEQLHTAIGTPNELLVDGPAVIGSTGSQQGISVLHWLNLPVVGVASTIDIERAETETAIGVNTTLRTTMDRIDKPKPTATSHRRSRCDVALLAAIATGLEQAVIPQREITADAIAVDVPQ